MGNPRDQMTRYTKFVTILAPQNVRVFRIYSYQMEFVQAERRVCGKSSSFWWCKSYSAIWSNSREHSKIVLLSIWAAGTMYMNFDEKHSPNVLKNQTRLQYSAYTTRMSLIFRVLCALFEYIRYESRYSKNSYLMRS